MVSSFNQKHNKYTSTPDWFKDSKSVGDSVAGSGTNYGGAVIGSTYNTVDYSEIPIDNSTIVWQDEKLTVPIDNSTVVVNDEKLSVPIDNNTLVIKDGKLVVSFDKNDLQGDYVTVKGYQDIEGIKNFKLGILIDGVSVTKPQDDVIYIGGNLVVKGGITMYADGGDIDIPDIYDGIPIDYETIFWGEDADGNKVLKSKSGTIKKISISGEGNALSGVYLTEDNTALQFLKSYTFATIGDLSKKADQTYVDETFVTFKNDEDIEGVKNFLNGIKIKGLNIKPHDDYDDVIYMDANLVVRGGITMYSDGVVDIPNIMDIITVDGITITKDDGVLKVNPDAEFGLNEDELAAYLADKKYATQSWVYGLKYASASALSDLTNKVDDFLEGSDTDAIINKWKELETFLSGLSETDNLATILSTKADKATTLEGYGITDAYTKTKTDELLGDYVPIKGYTEITGEKNFTGGLNVNGSPIVYNSDNKYWKLEGDLLITGGITMYGSDNEFVPSTIMDAIETDEVTITKKNGVLQAIGGTGGGSINEDEIKQIIESYDYLTSAELPVATTSAKGIASFDSSSFNVSNGHVSFSGAKVKVVTSAPTTYESDTLYVITG